MAVPRVHTFTNGLRLVLAPCEAESVAFGLFVGAGSRHETARTAGISHFIEHMLFKGTKKRRPIDITREIEGRGGNFNAFTGEESTCYYAHLPHEFFGEAVDIILDMYLNATIPEDEFEREKGVIVEEIRMYSDEPDSVAMENLQKALFPGNGLGMPVAGTPESLAPMRPADLRRYIAANYLPSRTVAVIAGRFDEARAVEEVARRIGRCRRRGATLGGSPVDFSVPPCGEVAAEKDVQQTQLAIGYRTFGVRDRRKYAAIVMDAVLGRGMSSRLFQEVREKRGLSYDIASRMQFFQDAGMFTVAAGMDGAKSSLAVSTIDRVLDGIRSRKVPRAELERTKAFILGNFRLTHESVKAKLFFYGSTMLSFGRLVTTDEQVDAVRSVTATDVLEAAEAVLDPANRSVSRVVPLAGAKRPHGGVVS